MDSCVHLAATGFDALPLALVALALLIGGAITVAIVARKRRGWLAALALGALLVTGAGLTSATPAQAAHCVPVTAVDDVEVIVEDGLGASVSGNVLANDAGTGLSVANPGTYELEYGTLVIAANGEFTYTLDNDNPEVEALGDGETLTETFTVQIRGAAGTAKSVLRITITGHTDNELPTAAPDTASVVEDALPGTASGDVLANDSDPDGDTLTASLTSAADYGTVTIAATGAFLYTLDNGDAAVTALNTGETLTDVIDYSISDGRGGTDSSTLTITITGATDNRPPVAVNDAASVVEGENGNAVSGNLLTNDSDPDGDALTLSVTTTATYGTLVLGSPTGAFTYTLDPATAATLQTGQVLTDTITYQVSDGDGATATALLTVTIIGLTPNSPPGGLQDVYGAVTEDIGAMTVGTLLPGAFDPDGDLLTPSVTSPPLYGSVFLTLLGFGYTLDDTNPTVDALGAGETLDDVIEITVSDGRGGTGTLTMTITIHGTNDAPVASPDTNAITTGSLLTGVTGDVLANDTDVDDASLTVSGGTAIGATYGTLTLDPHGSYLYQVDLTNPAVAGLLTGQTLTTQFDYTVTDGDGATSSSTLTITINGPGAVAPVAVDDENSIKEDTAPNPISGNVLTNDSDANGDPLTVTNPNTFPLDYGILVLNSNGSYTYTLDNSNPAVNALNAGQTLTDLLAYGISDGRGGVDAGLLTITINGTTDNRPPVVEADINTVTEDATPNTVTGNVLTNDTDPDGNVLTVANAGTITLQYGSLQIHADGSYTYTLDNSNPAVNALNNGQHLSDMFTYTASDGHGGTTSSILTVRINGTTDNRPPVVEADTNTVKEDATPHTVSGNVLTNDTDPDGHVLTVANAGTVTLQYGSLEIHADGSYTYTLDNSNPAVNALSTGQHLTDTFTYVASDGHGGTTSSTLTITIDGTTDAVANRPPVVVPDAAGIAEDAVPDTVSGWVLDNDSDPDGDTLTVVNAVTIPLEYGSIAMSPDGSWTYSLDNSNPAVDSLPADQTLMEAFPYTASDGQATASGVLTITIVGVANAPLAVDDSARVDVDSLVTGNVLANDTDADGDSLTVTNAGRHSFNFGTLTIAANGGYTFVTAVNHPVLVALRGSASVSEEFVYEISDGAGGTSSARLSITIYGVNNSPVGVDDTLHVERRLPFTGSTGNLLSNDSDPDGDALTAEPVWLAYTTYGIILIEEDGTFSYSLDPDKPEIRDWVVGTVLHDQYQYILRDGSGAVSFAYLHITITG